MHTVAFYSIGYLKNGAKVTEIAKQYTFLVDTKKPEITVESPESVSSPLYTLSFSVSDANFDYAKVEINSITFVFTDKDWTLPLYLFDKETEVKITAFDRAGNKEVKVFVVKLNG